MTAIDKGRRLTLAPILDILVAEPLREMLRESVVLGGRLEIDAGMVERVTTPCVQVLVAGTAALSAKGIDVAIRRPSEPFMTALYDLGLRDVVAQWTIEA